MHSKISTLICDNNKDILLVLNDELSLIEWTDLKSLTPLVADDSQAKLNILFERAKMNQAALNWELETTIPYAYKSVYFSVIGWLGQVILRISDKPVHSFFFDLNLNSDIPSTLFYPYSSESDDGSISKNRMNNELQKIQRELQRKNVHLEQLNERMEVLATTDPLTGLYNRRAIFSRANNELLRAKREKRNYGLAILDIDGLKAINDRNGHPFGDECLIELTNVLRNSSRQYDLTGRIGGDEFLVFYALASKEHFSPILFRLQKRINHLNLFSESGEKFQLRVSIGGVCFMPGDQDIKLQDLLSEAEKALKKSKISKVNKINIIDL